MKNLAIIPARSGSKGLKDKNIKLLNGKPLLVYSIEAARESELFDTIYVSTDSEKYAEIAREGGAEVPFLRNAVNATDTASSWDVVKEALERFAQAGKDFDMVTLLQPTTPLRSSKDIINAYEIFYNKKSNAVVSVCEMNHSPLWCNVLPEDNSLNHFLRNNIADKPRQSLDTYYRINGAIYMVNTLYLENSGDIYGDNCYAYIMKKENSVDIDDRFDFIFAEVLLKLNQ